jgi:2-dehydro-3-deoxyphosphogluconate aldolase/(4S)-4-hydroxy-2-oxoglutarate aldolase
VASIPNRADSISMARALQAGGIHIIEVMFRTRGALPAIEAIAGEFPRMQVGAGTVWTAEQARDAIAAGAGFIVSPGGMDEVYDVCMEHAVPYLPGVQTVTEAAHWWRRGLRALKFFPAAAAGGPAALKAMGAVLPEVQFVPTGGISLKSAPDYLALPNVPCVCGSWLVPLGALDTQDWARVETLAAQACEWLADGTQPFAASALNR